MSPQVCVGVIQRGEGGEGGAPVQRGRRQRRQRGLGRGEGGARRDTGGAGPQPGAQCAQRARPPILMPPSHAEQSSSNSTLLAM